MKNIPWIVVTGLDGSGKTSLIDNLARLFNEKGLRINRFRSPHDHYLVHNLLNVSGDGEPMKDRYTDRLIFALDNRILGTRIRHWDDSEKYDLLLSQRGFFDSFVHGAVQGYTYHDIAIMNQIDDLPKCTVMIHLCADSTVAFNRIKDDDDMDKFETPSYMRKQEFETRRGFRALTQEENADLSCFKGIKNFFIDTTELTSEEVFRFAWTRLEKFLKDNFPELAEKLS